MIYGWNFLTGAPVKYQSKSGSSQTLKVPQYYTKLSEYLRNKDGIFRVASVPTFIQKDVFVVYRWGDKVFVGAPSLNVSMGKPTLRPFGAGREASFLGEAYMRPEADLISQDAWRMMLRFSNVRYVTLHNDTDWGYLQKNYPKIKSNSKKIHEFVDRSPFLKKIKTIGKIDLFEVDEKDLVPHVYAASSASLIDGGLESLPSIANCLKLSSPSTSCIVARISGSFSSLAFILSNIRNSSA